MLNLKTLTSGIAATALVSVIGLAYAQTSPPATDSTQMQTPSSTPSSTAADTSMPTTPSSTTTPADSALSEQAPQADRN